MKDFALVFTRTVVLAKLLIEVIRNFRNLVFSCYLSRHFGPWGCNRGWIQHFTKRGAPAFREEINPIICTKIFRELHKMTKKLHWGSHGVLFESANDDILLFWNYFNKQQNLFINSVWSHCKWPWLANFGWQWRENCIKLTRTHPDAKI